MAKKKILLVDDLNFFLKLERSFLKAYDFELVVAQCGLDALTLIKKEKPDLVFLDLYMPDLDGDKCCRIIKSDQFGKNIPVVMVTNGSNASDFERCWQAGCDEIISKPINRHFLSAVIHKMLGAECDKTHNATRLCIHYYAADQRSLLTDYSIDLSDGTLFIETENTLSLDTALDLRFIPMDLNPSIECQGAVAWINHPDCMKNQRLPVGMAIHLVNISPADLQSIRSFTREGMLVPFW